MGVDMFARQIPAQMEPINSSESSSYAIGARSMLGASRRRIGDDISTPLFFPYFPFVHAQILSNRVNLIRLPLLGFPPSSQRKRNEELYRQRKSVVKRRRLSLE